MYQGNHAIDIKSARSRVASIRKDREIPPLKAVEDLTACIEILARRPFDYSLAEAFAIRGTAYARGMEDHQSSFRDWRRALGVIARQRESSPKLLNLAGQVRVQMAFHSEGPARIRNFNHAMKSYRAADNPRAVAFVLVERGLTWKQMGKYRRALKDLRDGQAVARLKRMEGRRQLQSFIRDVKKLVASEREHR